MQYSSENPEELVDLIDQLMSAGSGHVNITADEENSDVKVGIINSTDFCGNKGACCQPTENYIDEDED